MTIARRKYRANCIAYDKSYRQMRKNITSLILAFLSRNWSTKVILTSKYWHWNNVKNFDVVVTSKNTTSQYSRNFRRGTLDVAATWKFPRLRDVEISTSRRRGNLVEILTSKFRRRKFDVEITSFRRASRRWNDVVSTSNCYGGCSLFW